MSPTEGEPRYREAVASDADAVAALHADSWRRNYRGAYLDSYLDGDVFADRRAVWHDRLGHPAPGHHTVVAEDDGAIVGFSHVILRHHPTWGAYLENLHVRHAHKGRGIGRRLMAEAAAVVLRSSPATGLHLSVLAQNVAAQGFYRAQGGTCVEERVAGPFPGGGTAPALCFAWPDPATLMEADQGLNGGPTVR
ncbi:MAG TPA: GNAT family N-acetyltransferase [Acidimicrobiales bacterium]|nr:GNAT family N-acetyltransferase [Acidimicrobiales bacterium]